jgi:hypothetical protein
MPNAARYFEPAHAEETGVTENKTIQSDHAYG